MKQPMTKGAGFTSMWRLVQETLTPAELTTCKSALPQDTLALTQTPPLAIAWLTFGHTRNMRAAMEKAVGTTRACTLYDDIAMRMLLGDLNTIYKILIRVSTIDFVLGRASALYGKYTQDCGTLDMQRADATHAVAHYRDVPDDSIVWGYSLGGACRGALHAVGAKNVRLVHVKPLPHGFDIDIAWDKS